MGPNGVVVGPCSETTVVVVCEVVVNVAVALVGVEDSGAVVLVVVVTHPVNPVKIITHEIQILNTQSFLKNIISSPWHHIAHLI